ncbi:MAG: DUF1080 domain-containing protein [Rhodothermales bacterium]|nr:DUF1080 domain-containing protein [Rhodothermales bacterium]MBO6778739.1 DUF1080 domain-containing protein [Rhodothermales bacterium]
MRLLSLFLLSLFLVACQGEGSHAEGAEDHAEENAEEHAEDHPEDNPTGEWIVLFDGTSLDNFRGFKRDTVPESWTIDDDGALTFAVSDDRGDLVTRDTFGDFELELEWKISPAGNSGIIYRASEEFDAPWMTGPEYQILDNTAHPDANFGDDRKAGANYDMHPANPDAVAEVGEWNTTRIVARGNNVEHWLNGEMVVSYELYSDDWNERLANSKWTDFPEYGRRMSGVIAFQDHDDPVYYRNIRVKPL